MHPGGAGKSNSQIAKHVGVDEATVRNWREKLIVTSEIPKSTARTGSDGRTINTENIGRRSSFDGGTRVVIAGKVGLSLCDTKDWWDFGGTRIRKRG